MLEKQPVSTNEFNQKKLAMFRLWQNYLTIPSSSCSLSLTFHFDKIRIDARVYLSFQKHV